MPGDLTLPGTIPGLLRRGSPVAAARLIRARGRGRRSIIVVEVGTRGVLIDAPAAGCVAVAFDGIADVLIVNVSVLSLNLTDATGRAHAAWWLADRLDALGNAMHPEARAAVDDLGLLRPTQPSPTHPGALVWLTYGWPFLLADLDPADARRLPDSSRFVDAEALRRVALNAAGDYPRPDVDGGL